jgi:class 3 adenylate cyclase
MPGRPPSLLTVCNPAYRQVGAPAERHRPQEVVALLNAYFGAIVPIIEAHGGTLNNYMGDGIMVIFGAPEARSDHALQAVRCAVAVVGQVHQLRDRWAALGYPGFRIGVGMHTGEVVIGMMGSPSRLTYTAIGDTVNAAARIEAENKQLGTEVLLSAQTREALPGARSQPPVADFEQERAVLLRQRNAVLLLEGGQLRLAQCGIEAILVPGTLVKPGWSILFGGAEHFLFDPCQRKSAFPDEQTLSLRFTELLLASFQLFSTRIAGVQPGQFAIAPQPFAARVAAFFQPVGKDQPAQGIADLIEDSSQEVVFGEHADALRLSRSQTENRAQTSRSSAMARAARSMMKR